MFATQNLYKTSYDPAKKIWSGLELGRLIDSDVSTGQVIFNQMNLNPEKILQISDNECIELTNREILEMSIRVAQHLEQHGLTQDDMIGFIATNSTILMPLVVGCFFNGIPFNPLSPLFSKSSIRDLFNQTKPKVIFCDGDIYDKVKAAVNELKLETKIFTLNSHRENIEKVDEFFQPTDNEFLFRPAKLKYGGNQTAAVLCSSGTTGSTKSICINHKSITNDAEMHCIEGVSFTFAELFSMSGMMNLAESAMTGMTRLVTSKPFSPDYLLELIEKYKLTKIMSQPWEIVQILQCPNIKKRDLSSIKLFTFCGSPLQQGLANKFQSFIKNGILSNLYSLTELQVKCSLNMSNSPGSVGMLSPNIEVKILDVNEDGKFLGPEEKGQIIVRSKYKWNGYYGNVKDTMAVINDEGWLYSGDIGHFNIDGELFITNRKKDIFRYNEFLIFPSEIEEVIMKVKGVAEVCVCGIPNYESTYLAAAGIVKTPGSILTEKELLNIINKNLSKSKQLHGGVYFLEFLPRTESGKIKRNNIQKMLKAIYRQHVKQIY